jgi:hypothetical protein
VRFVIVSTWTGLASLTLDRAKLSVSAKSGFPAGRLDASFHDPVYFGLTDKLSQTGARKLSSVADQMRERWKKQEPKVLYLDIGHINLASGTIEPVLISTADAPSRAQRLVQPWDVLVSTVRANRKNVAIVSEGQYAFPLACGFHGFFRSPFFFTPCRSLLPCVAAE